MESIVSRITSMLEELSDEYHHAYKEESAFALGMCMSELMVVRKRLNSVIAIEADAAKERAAVGYFASPPRPDRSK